MITTKNLFTLKANGLASIKTILLEVKTKYGGGGGSGSNSSNSFQQSQQSAQYSSLNTTTSFQDSSLSYKDSKEYKLTHEIKHECMKILKSFANTKVCSSGGV